MAEHTPGPWLVHTDGCNQVWTTVGLVAEVHDGNDEGVNDKERAGANARLIAAAPDLLEACKWALGHMKAFYEVWSEESDEGGQTSAAEDFILKHSRAEAAIAKAEGAAQ